MTIAIVSGLASPVRSVDGVAITRYSHPNPGLCGRLGLSRCADTCPPQSCLMVFSYALGYEESRLVHSPRLLRNLSATSYFAHVARTIATDPVLNVLPMAAAGSALERALTHLFAATIPNPA
jgi:hypothetical protein